MQKKSQKKDEKEPSKFITLFAQLLIHFLNNNFSFSSCRIKLHEEEHKLMKISTSVGTARRIRIRHKQISLPHTKKKTSSSKEIRKKFFWLYLLCNFKQKRQAGVQSNRNRFYGRKGRRYFYLKKIYTQQAKKKCCVLF